MVAHDEAWLMMLPGPFADPFFQARAEASEAEKLAHAREYRAAVRLFGQSGAVRSGLLFARGMWILFLAVMFGMPLFIAARMLAKHDWIGLVVALIMEIVVAALVYASYLRKRRIEQALAALAAAHQGGYGLNRSTALLDWLDAHWPAETPREVVDLLSMFERRWDVQMTHAGRPVLLVVQHRRAGSRSSVGHLPAVERISLYVSGSPSPTAEGAGASAAAAELSALGFWMKRTPAGVFVSHTGISPAILEPARMRKVLDVACRLVG